ncbi:MAG TPA: STAS domain-containing protein [Caldithrix abyssi]|uniref:Anti-sigma factor antagonist n=1 Tax=Caldithrix abyssi TaxID=187145 RepID=A0A7V4U2C6_CALAY|nr:STAS domain-containing protein [Caldithrix abyssi]
MEGIQVSTEIAGSRNHISVIKVGGYIDTTTSSELERALDSLLKQGRFFIIVDLGNVDYISSAGWGIFISEIKSIRENGGDLKLVRMVPDVYEIFELLEFHHILDVYDTIDEAINKFEMLEAAGKPVAKEITLPKEEKAEPAPAEAPVEPAVATTAPLGQKEEAAQPQVNPADSPLPEKIKMIVKENPHYGAYKIKKELNTAKYGFTKVGWFAVRAELNKLNLKSRNQRLEFAG